MQVQDILGRHCESISCGGYVSINSLWEGRCGLVSEAFRKRADCSKRRAPVGVLTSRAHEWLAITKKSHGLLGKPILSIVLKSHSAPIALFFLTIPAGIS